MNKEYDYAIIGSGVGGLFTGALLSHRGYSVYIAERHTLPGGYGHSFKRGKYVFCAQLHYLFNCLKEEPGYDFFRELGLEDQITFERLNPDGFDIINLPDTTFKIKRGFERNIDDLEKLFPLFKKGLQKYFKLITAIHTEIMRLPLGYGWMSVLARPHRYRLLMQYHTWTVQRLFDSFRFPPKLQSILAGQCGNLLVPPNECSLLIHAAMVVGYDKGACVPKLSYLDLFDLVVKRVLENSNCKVSFKTDVTGLQVEAGRVIAMNTAKGEKITAKNFIFNGDPATLTHLLDPSYFPKSFKKKLNYSYSPSNFTMYLGLKDLDIRKFGFGNWNMWHYAQENINSIFHEQLILNKYERPSLFISTPTTHLEKTSEIAPPGHHQMVVCTPSNYRMFKNLKDFNREGYLAAKERIADSILDTLEYHYIPTLRQHIDVKVLGSPTTNERFVHATYGNAYGMDLTPKNFRIGKIDFRTPFPNLFLVGASAGVPSFGGGIHFAQLLANKLAPSRSFQSARLIAKLPRMIRAGT